MIELTNENFKSEVLDSNVPVLVDFNADWCGPCQAMMMTVEPLAEKAEGFKVASVNIDDQPELARKYNVMTIPCFVVFKNGEEVAREVGMMSEKRLKKLVGVN